jgi:DNA polymerase-3 subunit epsilon
VKLLWFDTETTGLDPVKHDVIQIAGKVIVDGHDVDEFNLVCQPHDFTTIDMSALDVNGRTVDELRGFNDPGVMYGELMEIFGRHIDKFDKKDKFVSCGQNVRFDINFMAEFWKKCGDNYFFSWMAPAPLDTMQLAVMLEMKENRKIFSSYKLEIIYFTLFGAEMEGAHDAMSDIDATIRVGRELWSKLFNEKGTP